ncbi:MAG: hypothetical protein QG574_5240 [Cyanobacteriota bacterium erpe_2018_sw_21hr_WHONDRS-SW48-000092_B_bin.40]|jgi:predicted transcriptional regulator|nr:hypothetical protein [Cyanobacteriota bacterium erpe_2018_sw_21hr_WHONDRS-SW48-000092_B_bin.40]
MNQEQEPGEAHGETIESPAFSELEEPTLSRELSFISELFHRINRILPSEQVLVSVDSKTKVRDAVAKMECLGFSQLPVVDNGEVLGVFTFRSLGRVAAKALFSDVQSSRCVVGDLAVEECLEQFQFARVTDEFYAVFAAMDRDNGLLVGEPSSLQGILTPMDLLTYFYDIASPFVMLSEIELALRELVRISVTAAVLANFAERALSSLYDAEKLPRALEQMTFDNYRSIICFGDHWSQFEPNFGGSRFTTSAKLKEIGELRNDVFHFKRVLTSGDKDVLSQHRDWLLMKAKQADAKRREVIVT